MTQLPDDTQDVQMVHAQNPDHSCLLACHCDANEGCTHRTYGLLAGRMCATSMRPWRAGAMARGKPRWPDAAMLLLQAAKKELIHPESDADGLTDAMAGLSIAGVVLSDVNALETKLMHVSPISITVHFVLDV
jgi:hypothetical protein